MLFSLLCCQEDGQEDKQSMNLLSQLQLLCLHPQTTVNIFSQPAAVLEAMV